MENTSAIWQQPAHTSPTNSHFLADQQEPYKKACLLKKMWKNILEKRTDR